MEDPMRPTTATNDNVFDFHALLHPGTVFEHPQDVLTHPELKRQCPDLIFVKPRFEVYKAISQQIRGIFAEHTPIIEPLSLDEAYLDVTENLQGIPLARDVALAIRAKIREVTGLTASAGIS
jgi:nucleotidyltransferase/DNA polymerase involved in DNA repair